VIPLSHRDTECSRHQADSVQKVECMSPEITDTPPITANTKALLDLYRQMLTIREFEEKAQDLYSRALIPGLLHSSVGQEAAAVGVCAALRPDDYVASTHRGHGHCIAKGADLGKMFAELFGKAEGYCRGKGGSMHIANPDVGNLGANAIVGGNISIVTGAALSAKMRGTDQVAVSFFGDGALNQGIVLESMNMAAIWRLPVIFVCENNQYGEYTPMEQVTAGEVIQRGKALGISSAAFDGMDVLEVYRATRESVERARRGDGPSFLVFSTYRYYGHGMSDRDRPYRTRDEEKEWRQSRDPLDRFAAHLMDNGQMTSSERDRLHKEIGELIHQAVEFGMEAAYPDPDEVSKHVYSD
jgi:TPP-dependent pyruvate/acetoin dehydrogenase alpha subunit